MEVVKVQDSSTFVGIPHDEIEGLWPRVAEFLEKPLQRTGTYRDYDLSDLYLEIKSQKMQCWMVIKDDQILGVALTQIYVFPRRKILAIPFVGAVNHTIHLWVEHIEVLKDFARYHGCSAIRGWGRAGWVKVLKPDRVKVEFELEV